MNQFIIYEEELRKELNKLHCDMGYINKDSVKEIINKIKKPIKTERNK